MKMAVTTYDDYRKTLRKMMEDALEYARANILDSKIYGYDEMKEGYALDVFVAIDSARRTI